MWWLSFAMIFLYSFELNWSAILLLQMVDMVEVMVMVVPIDMVEVVSYFHLMTKTMSFVQWFFLEELRSVVFTVLPANLLLTWISFVFDMIDYYRKRHRDDDRHIHESSKRNSDHESRRNTDHESRPVFSTNINDTSS